MKKVLLLYGGKSFEHEISCMSENNISSCLKNLHYDFDKIYISKENKWFLIKDNNKVEILNIIDFMKRYDVIFPLIHGAYGEDGRLQSFLELFDIDYLGPDSTSSMIAMNKYLTKILVEKHDIKQIPYMYLNSYEIPKNIEFPVIIKPNNGGSSIGISVAHNMKELKESLKIAFKYDKSVLIEKFIKGVELECGIIKLDKYVIGDVGEIKYTHEFYDYEAKYEDETKLIIPAKINRKLTKRIKNEALKIFKILSLNDFARIDFIYDNTSDTLYFNEVNTIPGFTNNSMFPLMFKNFPKLIGKIIENKKVL